MAPSKHIRLHILPIIVARLRDLAIAPADLVPGLVLDPPDADGAITIEVSAFRALCAAAAARLGDDHLGLHAAAALPPGAYGLVEFVIRTAPTCRDALERLVRLAPLLNNMVAFTVVERAGRVQVDARIDDEPTCFGRHANEFAAAIFLKVGREIAGRAWAPDRVWFAHPAIGDTTELARHFGTDRLEFDATSVGFEFGSELLDIAIPTADVALYSLLDRQASERVARLGADQLEVVREKIRVALQSGRPDIRRVAALLGTSVRSLQRKLADASTSFRELTDEVRQALARLYLDDHARPVTEIAFLLGFSDLRSFARAHKRWSGKTPNEARRTLASEVP